MYQKYNSIGENISWYLNFMTFVIIMAKLSEADKRLNLELIVVQSNELKNKNVTIRPTWNPWLVVGQQLDQEKILTWMSGNK